MEWTAAIVAKEQQQFDNIVARLAKAGLNIRYHYCSGSDALAQLMFACHIDVILYSPDIPGAASPHREVAELLLVADRKQCPVCFISRSENCKLVQSGLIPTDSHFLHLEQDPQTLQDILVATVSSNQPPVSEVSRLPLTIHPEKGSVCNPTTFCHWLEQEISHSALTGRPFSVLLLAPQQGDPGSGNDPLWQELSARLSNQIRSSDLLCYLAGTGLLLLLPETSTEVAVKLATRIHVQNSTIPGYNAAQIAVTRVETAKLLHQLGCAIMAKDLP